MHPDQGRASASGAGDGPSSLPSAQQTAPERGDHRVLGTKTGTREPAWPLTASAIFSTDILASGLA
jgi:hypothetical protein